MAVPISNVVRRVVFAPSGTGPYAFTFEILAATDIEVYKGDTLLTLTTDYTVTINPNGTGEVTLVATAGTDNITIVGARTIQRTTDFVTGGDLFANSLNEELDSLTIFTQQNAEAVARSLTAPVTDPTTIDMTLPRAADRAGKFLSFDSNGNPVPGAIPPEVQQVLAIEDELIAVAAIDSEIVAVDANEANIITVAGITSDLATVAGVAANVTTVAGIAADVTSVAGDATDIGAVAAISSDVTTVAGIAADVTAVAGVDAGDLAAVAAIDSDVTTVAGIAANVTTVAGIDSDVTAVAADATDIGTVAGSIANVNTVAGIDADVTTVAGISADVTAVAGDATDIGTVAGIAANVTTVAGIAANVTTVAGISSDVTTVATNVTDITNFSDVYLGPASSDPATRNDSSALQAGDLYFNTVDDAMKVYDGAAWVTAYITAAGFVTVADAQTITGVKTFDNGLATDTISEETSAAGVTIDGVLLKDSEVTTDVINEKTSAAGVTVDGVLLKDTGVGSAASPVTLNSLAYPTEGSVNFRNRIINGDMRIDQRNAGAAVTTSNTFVVDRFNVSEVTDGDYSGQQDSSAPVGFVNSLKLTTTTADGTLTTNQNYTLRHRIEGTNVADLAWGTANAKTVTLSFWVRSSLTGTFGGSFRNSATDRSYPFTYSISVADTWEYKTVTIPGDTSGTWLTTTGVGIRIDFGLGVGPDRSGTAGAWAGANYQSATGATSVIGTLNATWYITGVQLEVGSVATPFERRPFGTELALCQRYYQHYGGASSTGGLATAFEFDGLYGAGVGNGLSVAFPLPVVMRATPTASANYTDTLNVSLVSLSLSAAGVGVDGQTSGSGRTAVRFGANGYLNLTAEL
jgi:hypothetical protein